MSAITFVYLLMAFRGEPKLILDNKGFTIRSILSKRVYYWSDRYDFAIRDVGGFKSIRFWQRGSDGEGKIVLTLYRESAEEILKALKDESERRAPGA